MEMTIDKLRTMWKELSNVPINSDDEIELNFYWWEKGTYRFEIWHWFDEKMPNGLVVDFNI